MAETTPSIKKHGKNPLTKKNSAIWLFLSRINETNSSWWFKVPFSSPIVGGHDFTPWKGHVFTIPKRSLWITWFFCSTKALKNHDISVIVRRYINAILSSSGVDWHGGHFQGIFPWCSIGIKIWCIIYLIETSATHDGNFTFSKQDAYTMKTWTAQSILKRQPASLQVAVHFHILSSTLPPKPATVA